METFAFPFCSQTRMRLVLIYLAPDTDNILGVGEQDNPSPECLLESSWEMVIWASAVWFPLLWSLCITVSHTHTHHSCWMPQDTLRRKSLQKFIGQLSKNPLCRSYAWNRMHEKHTLAHKSTFFRTLKFLSIYVWLPAMVENYSIKKLMALQQCEGRFIKCGQWCRASCQPGLFHLQHQWANLHVE